MFKDALPETCKKCKQDDLRAAGQLYSNVRDKSDHRHVKQFTEQVLNMAMDLNYTTILEKLSTMRILSLSGLFNWMTQCTKPVKRSVTVVRKTTV